MKFRPGDKVQWSHGSEGPDWMRGTVDADQRDLGPGVVRVVDTKGRIWQLLESEIQPWPTRWRKNPFDPAFQTSLGEIESKGL